MSMRQAKSIRSIEDFRYGNTNNGGGDKKMFTTTRMSKMEAILERCTRLNEGAPPSSQSQKDYLNSQLMLDDDSEEENANMKDETCGPVADQQGIIELLTQGVGDGSQKPAVKRAAENMHNDEMFDAFTFGAQEDSQPNAIEIIDHKMATLHKLN